MRLLRISLVALVSMTINAGCSAARNHLSPWRGQDRDSVVPEEHEYSPRTGEPEYDEFRNPSGEPAPAPPAMGVSKVKSVSFLKDISAKLHRRKDDCAADCVDDSELVGRCSPVEPCVPCDDRKTSNHRSVGRRDGSENANRLNPLRSLRKSLTKVFHGTSTEVCSSECAEIPCEPGCDAQQQSVCTPSPCTPRDAKACRKPEPHYQGLKPLTAQPMRNGDELADPLEEQELQNAPGRISPDDHIRSEESSVLPVPQVPTVPTTLPPAAPLTNPLSSEQSEEVPVPPAVPSETRQSVEPPVWPRLQGRNRPVFMSTSGVAGSSGSIVIQPRPDR
ncbi:MAG: hypothetical protein ACK58L_11900 [Planctomycetota bacterium]